MNSMSLPTLLISFTVFALVASSSSAPCQASTFVDSSSPNQGQTCDPTERSEFVDFGTFIQVAVQKQPLSDSEHVELSGLADQHSQPVQAESSSQERKERTESHPEENEEIGESMKSSLSSFVGSVREALLGGAPAGASGAGATASKGKWVHKPIKEKGLDEWDTFDTILIVSVFCVLVLFDFCVLPMFAYNFRNHVVVLLVMLICSGWFWACVWWQRGQADGLAWATGYVVEWALSLDNLFVFHLVFKSFSVPNDQSVRALSVGIYGAIVFRVIFILGLTQLFKLNYWVDVVVGGVLILSGLFSLCDDDEEEVQNLYTVRFFKWLFGSRLQDSYSQKSASFFETDAEGKTQMTVLFLVVCVISVVDVVFAVDSVGSKTGQIKSAYINLSSCLMAMFSLRSMFFIIRDTTEYFDYVKYGICAILCFVGVEMIISKWFSIPLGWMCVVISALFGASILASILKAMLTSGSDEKEDLKQANSKSLPSAPSVVAG